MRGDQPIKLAGELPRHAVGGHALGFIKIGPLHRRRPGFARREEKQCELATLPCGRVLREVGERVLHRPNGFRKGHAQNGQRRRRITAIPLGDAGMKRVKPPKRVAAAAIDRFDRDDIRAVGLQPIEHQRHMRRLERPLRRLTKMGGAKHERLRRRTGQRHLDAR